MGEYADMMIDGTCCVQCGEYLFNDDPWGIPELCEGCQSDLAQKQPPRPKPSKNRPHQCGNCGKTFSTQHGLSQHSRDKHGALSTQDRLNMANMALNEISKFSNKCGQIALDALLKTDVNFRND